MAAERAGLTRGAADAGVAAIPATGSAVTVASRAETTPRRTSERRPVAVRVIGDLPACEVSCRVRARLPGRALAAAPRERSVGVRAARGNWFPRPCPGLDDGTADRTRRI